MNRNKRFKEELLRLRTVGLEPIPCLDFSAGHCAWLGQAAGTAECLSLCLDLVKDIRALFGHPRYFQIIADGWSAADRETFRQAIIARGYGSCPWPKWPLLIAHRGAGDRVTDYVSKVREGLSAL